MKSMVGQREVLLLPGPCGRIEAMLEIPPGLLGGAVALVCHPHPQQQGTMGNKVVHTLVRALNNLGVPAVRFNFRGVGASEGAYGEGIGETEDVLAMAEWASQRFPGAELWLAGFSFGAAVAWRAAAASPCRQLISVAPPVMSMGNLLSPVRPACPWLLIQGGADEVVKASEVVAFVQSYSPPPDLVVLPEVGHFFHGQLNLLRDTVVSRVPRPGVLAC